MAGYQTLFVVGEKTINWFPLMLGIAFTLIAIIIALTSKTLRNRLVALMMFIVGVTVALDVYGAYQASQERLEAFRSGKCAVVEGYIRDFLPMPPQGHDVEQFRVGNASFSYTSYQVNNPCFNQTVTQGSPLRNGLRVKVWYQDNCILRLDYQPWAPAGPANGPRT